MGAGRPSWKQNWNPAVQNAGRARHVVESIGEPSGTRTLDPLIKGDPRDEWKERDGVTPASTLSAQPCAQWRHLAIHW